MRQILVAAQAGLMAEGLVVMQVGLAGGRVLAVAGEAGQKSFAEQPFLR